MSFTSRKPSNLKRKRDHGFRKRMSTKNGRKVLARRRKKGRAKLTVSDEQNSVREGPPFFLKKKHEYDGVRATGSVIRNPFFTIVYSQVSKEECPRIGVIAGRRVGKAVTRNRLKRITRELVRASHSDMAFGHHCIAYPKVKILRAKFQDVENAWSQMLRKIGMLQSMRPK